MIMVGHQVARAVTVHMTTADVERNIISNSSFIKITSEDEESIVTPTCQWRVGGDGFIVAQ